MRPIAEIVIAAFLYLIGGFLIYLAKLPAILLLGYCFAFALFGVFRWRGAAQNLCLMLASFFVITCLLETVALVSEPKSKTTKQDLSDAKRKLDDRQTVLGWRPAREGRYRALKTLNGRVVYDVIYTIDNNLLRKTHAASSGAGITFLGDSFVFGEGLNDAQTLPQQFADLEGRAYPIYNLGFPAYNVSQALIEMQTGMFDKLLNGSRLLVEFIAPWQAERTSCKASFVTGAPRYVDRDGKVELQGACHPTVSPWNYFAAYRVFVAPRLSVVRDSDIDIFVDVARATIQLAREKYKKPILVYYLRNPGYLESLKTWNDDKIVKALESAGATVLDYGINNEYGDPRYEIKGDGHPTGLANKIRAERLFTFLRKKFPGIEPQDMERLTPDTARQ